MLTEAELVQMTAPETRGALLPEELEALGRDLGHYVRPHTTEYACDSHEGYLVCECGWRSRDVKACWWRELVQAHLEEIVHERFDADGNEEARS